jgi:hypothetical protein
MRSMVNVEVLKMYWFVFEAGEEDEYKVDHLHSYSDAVKDAQAAGQTSRRPKRLTAGFYELKGASRSYYIATEQGMRQNGYGDLLLNKGETH